MDHVVLDNRVDVASGIHSWIVVHNDSSSSCSFSLNELVSAAAVVPVPG